MYRRAHSYIGDGRLRQMALGRGLAVALLALSLGGCAGLGLPFSEASGQLAANGSAARPILASAVITGQADPSDWEMVRRTVEGSAKSAGKVDWSNALTGSVGSIAFAAATADSACRSFALTINDTRGIRRYRGDACTNPDGRSQLRRVIADDATLL